MGSVVPNPSPAIYIAAALASAAPMIAIGQQTFEAIPIAVSAIIAASVGPHERFCRAGIGAKLEERVLPKVRRMVRRGMVFVESRELAQRIAYSLFALAVMAAGSIAALLISGQPLAMLGLALSAFPLLGLVSLSGNASSRREWVESEMPFFTTIAAALVRSGLSIYYVFRRVAEVPGVFRQMRREAMLIVRNVDVVGMDTLDAMDAAAAEHPSEQFRSLIYTVTGVSRTGGDVKRAIEDKGREAMRVMRQRWEDFASRMRSLGEMSIIVFVVLPTGLATIGIAFASAALMGMMMIDALLIPMLGLMFFIIVVGATPRSYDVYSPPRALHAMALALGMAGGIAGLMSSRILGASPAIALPIASLAYSLVIYLPMRGQVEEVSSSLRQLPSFLREVVEARKTGASLLEAVSAAAISGRYSGGFGALLKRVAARMHMFSPLEAAARARAWIVRMSFFMLQELEEAGGSSHVLMEGMVETIDAYQASRRRAAGSVRLHQLLSLMFPIIVLFATSMILAIAGPISSLAAAGAAGIRFATPDQIRSVVELAWIGIGEAGIAMTLAMSRAMDLHPYGTHRLALFSLILLAAILVQPSFQELLGAALTPQGAQGAAPLGATPR